MRILLLGAPGAGKGTQGVLLAEKYRIPYISSGALLRAAVETGTPQGLEAKAALQVGMGVGDELLLAIIKERLQQGDASDGYILQGFPDSIPQAELMDIMLFSMGIPLDAVLRLDIDLDNLMQRLTGRRICRSCGESFNIFTAPPVFDERCDVCGGLLRQRADDRELTIENKLRHHELLTLPLYDYFVRQNKLFTVAAQGEISDVFATLCAVVDGVESGEYKPLAPAVSDIPADEPTAEVIIEEPVPEKGNPDVEAPAKKAPVKKAPAKKAPAKKAPAKKAPATKAPAKKAPAKKAPTKKAPAKKAPAKKAPAKKAPAKKAPKKKTK